MRSPMRVFIKVFLLADISFSLPIAITLKYLFGGGWLSAILSSLTMGIIFGLVLASVAFVLTRYLYRLGCTSGIMVVILCLLGLVCSIAIYKVLDDLPRGEWDRLSVPPEKPITFEDTKLFYQSGNIHIRTNTGKVYAYQCSQRACEWVQVDNLTITKERSPDECLEGMYKPQFRTPKPPSRVIDSTIINMCGVDSRIQINFIITEDGNIWRWRRGYLALFLIVYIFIAPIGLLSGLVSTLGLFARKLGKSGWIWYLDIDA